MSKQDKFDQLFSSIHASKQPSSQTSKAKSVDPTYRRATLYLSKNLHKRLKQASLDLDIDMSEIAEQAIAQWIESNPPELGDS